jgi:hypothetical protein
LSLAPTLVASKGKKKRRFSENIVKNKNQNWARDVDSSFDKDGIVYTDVSNYLDRSLTFDKQVCYRM